MDTFTLTAFTDTCFLMVRNKDGVNVCVNEQEAVFSLT